MDLIIVDWVDSANGVGWHSSTELRALHACRCRSVGFLVAEDDDCLSLALNKCLDDGVSPYGQLITIPKRAITRRKRMKSPWI